MTRFTLTILTGLLLALEIHAAELTSVAQKFIAASLSGDSAQLDQIYLDSPTRERADAAFAEALPQIKAGKLKVTHVDKELVIGDLGVTLMRIEFEDHPIANFKPIVCVRTNAGWRLFPWASESDLKVLMEQRNPDERIHLKLFDTWAHLIEEQIEKEAKRDGAGPAARPESKSDGGDKPQSEEGRSR